MWWLFGLINIIVIILSTWFFNNKIKDGSVWTLSDKCAFSIIVLFAFLSGILGTLFIAGVFIYLVIDFVRFLIK